MLPNRKDLEENANKNLEDIFKGIKLSKKAEKKVIDLITTNIALTFKLRNVLRLHNEATNIFNHKFEYPQAEEVTNEVKSEEITQESNHTPVSN